MVAWSTGAGVTQREMGLGTWAYILSDGLAGLFWTRLACYFFGLIRPVRVAEVVLVVITAYAVVIICGSGFGISARHRRRVHPWTPRAAVCRRLHLRRSWYDGVG